MKQAAPKRVRGYLLLEVMASGAVLAVILGSAISMVAQERARVTLESNRATATALAQDLMQQMLADVTSEKHFGCAGGKAVAVGACAGENCVHNPNNAANPGSQTDDDPAPFPGFDRYYDCAQISSSAAIQGNDGKLFKLTVRVTYPGSGGQIDTVTHTALRRERWRE